MDIVLSLKYAEKEGLSPRPDSAAAIYAQVEQLVKALPKKHQESTAATFHRWADAAVELLWLSSGGALSTLDLGRKPRDY